MNRNDFIKKLTIGFIGLTGLQHIKLSNERNTVNQPNTKLLTTNIVGFIYYDGIKIEKLLKEGDRITIKRELDNLYDNKAIEAYWKDYKLGYIPRKHNKILSNLMDSNKTLLAEIRHINKYESYWNRVYVGIYLL